MRFVTALAAAFLRLADRLNGTAPACGRGIRDLSPLDFRQAQAPLVD